MSIFVPFSGRGESKLGVLTNTGTKYICGPLRKLGNQNLVEVAYTDDRYSRKDYTSKASGDRFEKSKGVKGTLTINLLEQDLDYENVMLLTRGQKYTQTTDVRPEEVFTPDTVAVGDAFDLEAFDVGAVVIKDSSATPITLVEGTHYTLDDVGGEITILSLSGGITGPLKRTVTPTVSDYVKAIAAPEREYFYKFDGLNIFASGSPRVQQKFFRIAPALTDSFQLINENDAEYKLVFNILTDSYRNEDGPYGQYGVYKAWAPT